MNGPPMPYRLPHNAANPYKEPEIAKPNSLMGRVFGLSSGKAHDKALGKISTKTFEQFPEYATERPYELIAENNSDGIPPKLFKTNSEKPPDKKLIKNSIKNSMKAYERITEKTFERAAERTTETAFEKASERTFPSDAQDSYQDCFQIRIRSLELAGIVVPNPLFRPLEHRLTPRDEYTPRQPRPSQSSSGSIVSPITVAQHRGQTNLSISTSTSQFSSRKDFQYNVLQGAFVENMRGDIHEDFLRSPHNLMHPEERQPLHIFSVATVLGDGDDDEIASWLEYLGPYHKGEYNLSNPPRPNLLEDFDYLPALYPANEIKRLSVYRQYERLWDRYGSHQGQSLVKNAVDHFGVAYASISFFDEENEIRKAEWGHCEGELGRNISLAAHVLYCTEVLVVLDTHTDWRFKGNPMVLGWPQIRFFAVSPMVAGDHVIGTFAIFDEKPRTSFGHSERQKLASFGATALAGMVKQHEWISRPEDARLTPLLERESSGSGRFGSNSEGILVQRNTLSKKCAHLVIDPRRRGNEHTPPSSSEENRLFGNPNSEMSRLNAKRSFATPPSMSTPRMYSTSDITSLDENPSPTPLLQNSRTANHSPLDDITFAQFMDLGDLDVCEQSERGDAEYQEDPYYIGTSPTSNHSSQHSFLPHPGPPPSYPPPPVPSLRTQPSPELVPQHSRANGSPKSIRHRPSINFQETASRTVRPQKSSSTMIPRPCRNSNEDTPTKTIRHQASASLLKKKTTHPRPNRSLDETKPIKIARPVLSTSSILSLQSIPPTPPSPRYRVAATSACANIARSLSFDLVYTVELKANNNNTATTPSLEPATILQDSTIRTKVLAYYPESAPLQIHQQEHLIALRKGARLCETAHATPPPGHYAWGIILPLTPGTNASRTDGVVLGAFRFSKTQASPSVEKINLAIKSLKRAAEPMWGILSNERNRDREGGASTSSRPRLPERERKREREGETETEMEMEKGMRSMRKYEPVIGDEIVSVRREGSYKRDLEGRRRLTGKYPVRERKLIVVPEQ